MTHEELLLTPEYWTAKIQIDLYNQVEEYITRNKINRSILAEQLGVSKGYITQVLNGDFDHRISKLVKLSLAIGCFPQISFTPVKEGIDSTELIKQTITELSKRIGCNTFLRNITPNTETTSNPIVDKPKPNYSLLSA